MAINLVIIDALNLIRRVHAAQYGKAEHSAMDAETEITQTSHVCCQAVKKIIQASQPSHIIAVFDKIEDIKDRGWRTRILPTYKEDRKPMPEVLQQGLDTIQNDFWKLGVDSLLSDGDEADDLIATLATKVAEHNERVTIISTDKGYCQLLSPYIFIRDYFQQRWLDEAFVRENYGVTPKQLPDFWGLAGISSSKVPGVSGIGPKAAKELLNTYRDLESILQAEDLPEKYAKKIHPQQEQALASRAVSYLKTDIELGFNLKDIRYSESPVTD